MKPDDVLAEMLKHGVKLSRPSLTRYENQGLIPRSDRKYLGRRRGCVVTYPAETVADAITAYNFISGEWGCCDFDGFCIPPEVVCLARSQANSPSKKAGPWLMALTHTWIKERAMVEAAIEAVGKQCQ